ncbi:MAG: hypothetical protein DRJ32_07640 [Thermoprotei archaeon]|nr:MAG: hypothetical protein DRJ32_07640 [Thermoprotei archaeon]
MFKLKAVFRGTKGLRPCESEVAEVTVKTHIASSIEVQSNFEVLEGESIVIKGKLNPPMETTLSIYYSLNGGPWILLTNITTSSDGSFTFKWTPSEYGIYLISVIWKGTGIFSPVQNSTLVWYKRTTFNVLITVVDSLNETLGNVKIEIYKDDKLISSQITGSLGTAEFTLKRGNYTIKLFYEETAVGKKTIEILSDVNLVIKANVYQLKVKVLDENENPVEGKSVTLKNKHSITEKTNSDGLVVFSRLPIGEYTVIVDSIEYKIKLTSNTYVLITITKAMIVENIILPLFIIVVGLLLATIFILLRKRQLSK